MSVRISILPKSPLARWSVGLAAAVILLIVLNIILQDRVHFETGSVGLTILGTAFGIFGIGSLVTGLISITKSRERSILVFLALVVVLVILIILPGFWIPGWLE